MLICLTWCDLSREAD